MLLQMMRKAADEQTQQPKKGKKFMKKITAILLIMCMVLCACSGTGAQQDGTDSSQQTSQENTDSDITGTAASDDGNAGGTENDAAPASEASATPAPAEDVPDDFTGKTLKFNTTKTYQTIDGFGGAFTWYAERIVNADDSEGAYDALFDDAKLSILRFKNEYEYNIEDKAENAITMAKIYKEARDRAAQYGEKIQVLLCCWSPPAKLKSDNSIDVGSGTLKKDANGNYCYDEYAAWWVESIQYYMSFGIQIDYVSLQNEVDFAPEDYEGCLFANRETEDKASYSKAFLAVYYAMKEAFGDAAPKLLGPETMSCSPATIKAYMKEALETEPDSVYGYAFHLYQGGTSDSSTMTVEPSSFFSNFKTMTTVLGDKPKFQTEFYIGRGIQTAELICNCFTQAGMTAYIYWSAVWADSTPDNFESADLIEINNAGDWRTSANYWALRHYSEFIRPGYVRIDALSGDSDIKACAFANEDSNKLAIVIVNPSEEDFEYRLKGTDYTITDSTVYQSVFGSESCESEEGLYANLGSLGSGNTFTVPAMSVTTIDITGYCGDTPIPVEEPEVYVYDTEVITDLSNVSAPTADTVILDTTFDVNTQISSFTSFGSAMSTHMSDMGSDGNGCIKVSGRTAAWNGLSLSTGYFEHYGYMLYVSYDCMMETEGQGISCTSSFSINGVDHYPDGENLRVTVTDMEAGKWYHAEGYMTMFADMREGSFKIYWESADNTDDFYLDNVKVTILYTQPVGDFSE